MTGSAQFEPGFATKSTLQQLEKAAIADAAVGLVEAGTAIGLSAGTTTYAIARRLVDVPGLTVVTNSPRAADVLHEAGRSDQTIILTGGVRTPSDALVGPFAVAALRSVHLDLVFLGVHGMDEQSGFTSPNLLEAETDRTLVEAGRRLVVVADHTKWGVVGLELDRPARRGGRPHHRRPARAGRRGRSSASTSASLVVARRRRCRRRRGPDARPAVDPPGWPRVATRQSRRTDVPTAPGLRSMAVAEPRRIPIAATTP